MLTLLLAGCAVPPDIKGTWIGYQKVDSQPDADPSIVKTLSKIELKVDGMNRFSLFIWGQPSRGKLAFSGDEIRLEINEVNGRAVEPKEPMAQVVLNKDGTLSFLDPALKDGPVLFKRKASF
ncbi:hypothetical protein BH11ARM1_BH11ARM1_13290 [soil metagenome]